MREAADAVAMIAAADRRAVKVLRPAALALLRREESREWFFMVGLWGYDERETAEKCSMCR